MPDLVALVRELGLPSALLYGLDRIGERFGGGLRVYYYGFLVQPVVEESWLPGNLGRSIRVREIESGDPALSAMPIPSNVIGDRFRQSAICLGAFVNEELVAYLWICRGAYLEDEVRCKFVPWPENQAVWDFDVFVFPKYRLGPAFARLWDEANKYLNDRGIRFTCSRVSRFNVPSIRAHSKLNARRVGSAIYFKFGRAQVMLASSLPFLHLSVGDSSVPTIRVAAEKRLNDVGR